MNAGISIQLIVKHKTFTHISTKNRISFRDVDGIVYHPLPLPLFAFIVLRILMLHGFWSMFNIKIFLSAASGTIFLLNICWKRNTIKVLGTSKASGWNYNASVKFVFSSGAYHKKIHFSIACGIQHNSATKMESNDFFAMCVQPCLESGTVLFEQFYAVACFICFVQMTVSPDENVYVC